MKDLGDVEVGRGISCTTVASRDLGSGNPGSSRLGSWPPQGGPSSSDCAEMPEGLRKHTAKLRWHCC